MTRQVQRGLLAFAIGATLVVASWLILSVIAPPEPGPASGVEVAIAVLAACGFIASTIGLVAAVVAVLRDRVNAVLSWMRQR